MINTVYLTLVHWIGDRIHTTVKNTCLLILKTMLESFYLANCGITMFHNLIFIIFNKKTSKVKELWILDSEYSTISSQMKDICVFFFY